MRHGTIAAMNLGKEFFGLQLRFAQRVAAASGLPLAHVLLHATNLYVRFGLGREFDAAHPQWQAYIAGLENTANAGEWTWNFYGAQLPDKGAPDITATAGCFSYQRVGDQFVRLHFDGAADAAHSPLSAGRMEIRQSELHALFALIHRQEAPAVRVLGTSWLYHLPAYRRLFPPAYIGTAIPAGPRWRNMSLWGQFLDRHGELKPQPVALFLQRLAATRATTIDGFAPCFPLQALALDAPASAFGNICKPG